MKATSARRLRRLRAGILVTFFGCFVVLFLLLRRPVIPAWLARGIFFALDPLILMERLAATRTVLVYALAALLPLALTLVFGRFFCGWVCPFGAIHEFISWLARKRQAPTAGPVKSTLRWKYLVLVIVAAGALAGATWVRFLDPFALLTRSAASAVDPAVVVAVSGFNHAGRVFASSALVGSIFLLVVALNAWWNRFFCNALCPLGALYGLVARFSLMRIAPPADCNGCRACSLRCSYHGDPGKNYLKSECVACLACVEDCPRGTVSIEFGWPRKTTAPVLDLGRRQVVGSAALGLALAAFPQAARGVHARTKAGYGFLRPPGAVEERLFLARCVSCGQCVEACPTGFIQPAGLDAGLKGIWTPVLNAQAGYCDYSCNACTRVCPTEAIEPLTLLRKQALKLGTAVINPSRCFTYAEGFNCTVCVDHCPVPTKPLRYRPVAAQDSRGATAGIHQVYVVPNLCTGCGICEHYCPRGSAPGIRITSEDEDREVAATG